MIYEYERTLVLDDSCNSENERTFLGYCKRFPPQINAADFKSLKEVRMLESGFANADNITYALWQSSQWPIVIDCDCCGEWCQPAAPAHG